jgi:hypothetical protein
LAGFPWYNPVLTGSAETEGVNAIAFVLRIMSSTSGESLLLFLSTFIPGNSYDTSVCSEGTSGERDGDAVALGDLALATF